MHNPSTQCDDGLGWLRNFSICHFWVGLKKSSNPTYAHSYLKPFICKNKSSTCENYLSNIIFLLKIIIVNYFYVKGLILQSLKFLFSKKDLWICWELFKSPHIQLSQRVSLFGWSSRLTQQFKHWRKLKNLHINNRGNYRLPTCGLPQI